MPSVEFPQPVITWELVLQAVALILTIAGAIVTVVKAVEAIGRVSVRKRVVSLEVRMNRVEDRLRAGDRRFQAQSDDLGQVLMTLQAVMMHMISGNDKEKLKNTVNELTEYIAKRHVHSSDQAGE